MAGHAVTDFLNVGQLRVQTLHDSLLLTCMANDYGYDHAFARIFSVLIQRGDALIINSSSGKSSNVCNAAVTLSGFAPDNRLHSLGDINIWLDSRDSKVVVLSDSRFRRWIGALDEGVEMILSPREVTNPFAN